LDEKARKHIISAEEELDLLVHKVRVRVRVKDQG